MDEMAKVMCENVQKCDFRLRKSEFVVLILYLYITYRVVQIFSDL